MYLSSTKLPYFKDLMCASSPTYPRVSILRTSSLINPLVLFKWVALFDGHEASGLEILLSSFTNTYALYSQKKLKARQYAFPVCLLFTKITLF